MYLSIYNICVHADMNENYYYEKMKEKNHVPAAVCHTKSLFPHWQKNEIKNELNWRNPGFFFTDVEHYVFVMLICVCMHM